MTIKVAQVTQMSEKQGKSTKMHISREVEHRRSGSELELAQRIEALAGLFESRLAANATAWIRPRMPSLARTRSRSSRITIRRKTWTGDAGALSNHAARPLARRGSMCHFTWRPFYY